MFVITRTMNTMGSATEQSIIHQYQKPISSHNQQFIRYCTKFIMYYCSYYTSTGSPCISKHFRSTKCTIIKIIICIMYLFHFTENLGKLCAIILDYLRIKKLKITSDKLYHMLVPYTICLINLFISIVIHISQTSHTQQFIRYYINFIMCYRNYHSGTGSPCISKHIRSTICTIIKIIICIMYLFHFMNCDRVTYYPIFKQQNITFGFYLDSQVPYFLSLIYILYCLVKLCANITSLIHVLDIMYFMFIISLLYLITYNFKVVGIMYLTIIISAQNLYIYNKLQFHISSVLTNELYIFKCTCCIHCNGISRNLLINNWVVNHFILIQNTNHFPR